MKDVTKNIRELAKESGLLSITEFIIGKRFYIHNSEKGVSLSQDIEYNAKNFNDELDLQALWESITKIYGIDERNMLMAPAPEYTLNCIYYSRDMMDGMPQQYPDKGIIIVEVCLAGGNLIPQSRLSEFCKNIALPCLDPIIVADVSEIKERLSWVRQETKMSQNKIPSGIVIKNEPPIMDDKGNPIRWYIAPNIDESIQENSQNPEQMAKELVETTLTIETIVELEKTSNVSPEKKVMFKNIMLNYLKSDRIDSYEEYRTKCGLGKNTKSAEKEFETFVRSALTEYLKDFILKLNMYKNRKA